MPARRVDKNGSLASVHIRRYSEALIADLCRAYPDIDGLRPDWPEYPPYLLDTLFLDFSAPARLAATRLGFNAERLRQDAQREWEHLHGALTGRDFTQFFGGDNGHFGLARLMPEAPGISGLCRLKALLVDQLLRGFREALTRAAGAEKELVPNAFPPPFTAVSGFAFPMAARHSSAISVKLYTMHWPMMLRFYGDELLQANPGLSSGLVAEGLRRLMDISDATLIPPAVESYSYPAPDVPHPVSQSALARKIRQAQVAAGNLTPINALAHGYGPPADFGARLKTAWDSSGGRVWINRYGYLSDEKMDAVRRTCASPPPPK